jgi:hypothetical protein
MGLQCRHFPAEFARGNPNRRGDKARSIKRPKMAYEKIAKRSGIESANYAIITECLQQITV